MNLLTVEQTDDLSCRIHRLYQGLATAASLDPSDEVDRSFRELVALSLGRSETDAARVLGDPIVVAIQENLQQVCARGEYALERHWAERVLSSGGRAWDELARFPYFANYEKLARLEWNGLLSVLREPPRRVLFIGSGPLPLTSIVLAATHGVSVDNLDVDADACRMASELAPRLGLADRLRFHRADGRSFAPMHDYDVIFVAALVGLRRAEKQAVVSHVAGQTRATALLVVRSAHRLKTLLYPEVKAADLIPFQPLLEIHPHHEVINSVIVAAKPEVA